MKKILVQTGTIIFILGIFLLFPSCKSEIGNKSTSSSNGPLLSKFIEFAPDSVIPRRVYLKKMEQWAEAGSMQISGENGEYIGASREVIRFNFNGDSYPDYFVVETEWGPPNGLGYIVNGKTGHHFEVCGKYEMFAGPLNWWRPSLGEGGGGIDYKIVDVNCGDGQEELVILHCQGPPMGSYHSYSTSINILRYDQDFPCAKVILNEMISNAGINVADTVWDTDRTYYLDFIYESKKCLNEIDFFPGFHLENSYPLCYADIRKGKGAIMKKFVFKPKQNLFVREK